MKIGTITKTNQKGQLVIPKEIREILGINTGIPLNLIIRGSGIYIYPIKEVIGNADSQDSYSKILEKTQGTWQNEKWDVLRKKRRQIELKSSQKRKQIW
ncbi:MAG: AbrB/MazE/SpoVT family DNA-binding domain-containing protein [Candidatus Kuenenbacteria bacterium]